MDYLRLSVCAFYRNERTNQIDYETYITTENMLPNRGGVVDAETLPDVGTVAKYLPNDTLLSNIRPYFKKIWLSNREGGCSNDVLVVAAKENVIPQFLYYVLSDNNFFNYDTVTSKGTKMPRGTPNAIMKYLVPNICVQQQKRIVTILSAYDNLVEVNNKRIKALEQMAENLYKEWFVRFRFPGHETAEFENGIPKGWETTRLGHISNISTGKSNRQDADENGQYPFFDRSQEIKRSNIWLKDCEGIIVPGEGTSFVPKYYQGKFDLHQRCYCVEPKYDGMGKYLYYVLYLNRHYFLSVATGATVPSLRLNNFLSMKFVLPTIELCKRFNEIASQIFNQVDNYRHENENLIKQRDLLLPRLMSGKLEV